MRRWPGNSPTSPATSPTLADNLDSLALAQAQVGRPGVEDSFRAANAIYAKLVAAHPDNVDYRIRQALSLRNQGAILADGGQPDRAEQVLRQALTLLDSKDAKAQSPQWQRTQAEVLSNLGRLQRAGVRGRPPPLDRDLRATLVRDDRDRQRSLQPRRRPEQPGGPRDEAGPLARGGAALRPGRRPLRETGGRGAQIDGLPPRLRDRPGRAGRVPGPRRQDGRSQGRR